MINVTPFVFDSHKIRVVIDENSDTWFVGKDICEALGYVRPSDAMQQHCRGAANYRPIVDALGRTQEVRVLSELDIFRLIMGSKLPLAGRFEKWVFEDVLPSIRKTGGYQALSNPAQKRPTLAQSVRDFKAVFGVGKLLGLDDNVAAISANQAVLKLSGTNLLETLGLLPLKSGQQELSSTPTTLGWARGMSGRKLH